MKSVMFLLVALFGAPAILCFPTDTKQVPPQCADPTFACQDLESARLCGVVKSCIHDIWSTMSAPDDNDDICQICKEMVKEARDQLLSNMTQEEIKEVFEGSCKLLPVKLVADACIKAVDEFIPELVEMLASRMDPNMVCTVSGLCNLAHLPIHGMYKTLLSLANRGSPFSVGCDQCTMVVSRAKKMISGIPKVELNRFVENIIRVVKPGSYDKTVLEYVEFIYTFLTSAMEPKAICSISGACPMTCVGSDKPKDELTCEFCTNVLEHIKNLVTANSTVEEFRTALLNFCNVTGSFSSKCTAFVDDYFDTIFGYIRNMDSKAICTLIGVCNNGRCLHTPLVKVEPAVPTQKRIHTSKVILSSPVTDVKDRYLHPLIKILPPTAAKKSANSDENDGSNEIFGSSNMQLPVDRLSHPLMTYTSDLECNFCKAITFYLESDLGSDTRKETVENALNKVCNKWVPDYPEYCSQFLSKYSLKMKQSIIESGDFVNVCHHINACSAEEKPGIDVKVIKNDNPLCELCKTACDEIENQLKDASVKKSVEQALYQICNYLPKSMIDDCQTFINSNIDNIFNILEQELDGDNVCPALHLCPGVMPKVVPVHVKDIECDLCKDLVQQFQQQLQDPTVKQSFKNLLDSACSILPQEISTECKNFVDQNIDNLINIIVQDLDPTLVCSALKICKSSELPKPKKVGDLECDLCKEVIQKVVDQLNDGPTEEEIKEVLEKVCSYFPSSFAAKCDNFVAAYTPMLIHVLAEELDPAMVCAALNICPAKKEQLQRWKSKAKDIECEGCQYVFHFIQEKLMNTGSQEKLKEMFKRACKLLPQAYADNCADFIDEFGSSLLVLIAQELDPTTACKVLNVCTTVEKPLIQKPDTAHVKDLKLDECNLCTTVVDYLDKLLEEDDVDKEITALVEKVCSAVPSLEDQCSTLIETYGPYILQMIGQLADSKEVCQAIDMCPRVAGHVHLLGGEKCTFGPSYWCQSKIHASACKAESYCKQRVWDK